MKAIIFDYNRTLFNPETGMLFSGAIELVKKYKDAGFKLFLIAKGNEERKQQVKDLGVSELFEKIIIEPEKTVVAFEFIQGSCLAGTQFYVVGDRVKKEVRFGNQCGMTTIWIRGGKFASEEPSEEIEKPNYTIKSLGEIEEIIEI